MCKEETAQEGDGAVTGDFERAHAHTSGAVSECALVAITSSRAGGSHDVNKLSRAVRAQFNAISVALHAISGICSSASDGRVRMRVRLDNCFLHCVTRAISQSDKVSRDASAARECGLAVRRSSKFSWTLAVRDATA